MAGASQLSACKVIGITPKTLQRWNATGLLIDRGTTRKAASHNQLSKEEGYKVLQAVNQSEQRELAPRQIVSLLADEGRYLPCESTMYRVLKQVRHRQNSEPRNSYKPKPLTATSPNQSYTWDITYLRSRIKGKFYYLYLIIDIYSR